MTRLSNSCIIIIFYFINSILLSLIASHYVCLNKIISFSFCLASDRAKVFVLFCFLNLHCHCYYYYHYFDNLLLIEQIPLNLRN